MNNGIHVRGALNKTLEGADLPVPYLLVKKGSTEETVEICGAGDVPYAIATDPGIAGDVITVEVLGCSEGTKLVVGSEDLSGDIFLVPAANGKAAAMPTAAGTYEVFGHLVKGADADVVVEFDPKPHQRTVT